MEKVEIEFADEKNLIPLLNSLVCDINLYILFYFTL